jgi:hypothetical protein
VMKRLIDTEESILIPRPVAPQFAA